MAETESKNLKRSRVDSDNSLESYTESHPDSPEAKRLHADLLEILDDPDSAGDRNDDLASVMKSFEEEIASSLPQAPASDSGEYPPDLGYLLEASETPAKATEDQNPTNVVAAAAVEEVAVEKIDESPVPEESTETLIKQGLKSKKLLLMRNQR